MAELGLDPKFNNIDIWNLVARESTGDLTLNVYPPPSNNSGVTVGPLAIDVGRQDIDVLNISDELKNKLEPFRRKTGDRARQALEANPLTLSKTEIAELSNSVMVPILDRLKKDYETERQKELQNLQNLPEEVQEAIFDSNQLQKWEDLTTEQRSVLYNTAHHQGGLRKDNGDPFNLLTQAVRGNWNEAVTELKTGNWGSQPDRYQADADYYEDAVKARTNVPDFTLYPLDVQSAIRSIYTTNSPNTIGHLEAGDLSAARQEVLAGYNGNIPTNRSFLPTAHDTLTKYVAAKTIKDRRSDAVARASAQQAEIDQARQFATAEATADQMESLRNDNVLFSGRTPEELARVAQREEEFKKRNLQPDIPVNQLFQKGEHLWHRNKKTMKWYRLVLYKIQMILIQSVAMKFH